MRCTTTDEGEARETLAAFREPARKPSTPSLSELEALVEPHVVTAQTRHIAIDVRVDGGEISGQVGDGTGWPSPFRGWLGLIGALDRLLANPTIDESD